MLAGIDEAGRGPVLGPLVVAGVALAQEEPLRRLGVKDSKKLSPQRRELLESEIRKLCKVELVVVPAEDIDAMRDEMSLNAFEAKLFATILERLRPMEAYVDAVDSEEEKFRRAVERELTFPLKLVAKHEADSLFPVVSAASIVAKVTRDAEVARIEAEIGQPIGSGYPTDPITVAFFERWVREKGDFPPHTRRSWKTARRLWQQVHTRRMEDFGGG